MSSAPHSDAPVAVTGVGQVTPAGEGLEALMRALERGVSLARPLDRPWAEPPHQLGCAVGHFSIGAQIPARRLRRVNRLPRMALAAAHQALEQGGLLDDPAVGAVLGTGLGALEETVTFMGQLIKVGPAEANPGLFPASVMNVSAAVISMELGLRGYNTTVNHKEVSAELALCAALDALRLGHAEAVLTGGVDQLTWPVHHGYRRLGGLASGPAQPYGAGRDGVVLGEGAAMLLLETEVHARQRGARVLAWVRSAASAGGARPMVGWGPAAEGDRSVGPAEDAAVRAVQLAIDQAGLQRVDLVVGSAGGGRSLDRLEALALDRALGDQGHALTSPHGTLGSWMGAGAARLASAVGALRRQRVYPTVTAQPDPELPLPGLVTAAEQRELNTALVCGHATGGVSAAAVLARGEV